MTDADWLRARYLDDRWSAKRIGVKLGVCEETARQRLKAAGVPLRTHGRAGDLEQLVRRYDGGATTAELALDHGLSIKTIRKRLRRGGVTLQKAGNRPRRAPVLDDETWLRRRYVDEGASTTVIAAELGCASGTVRDALIRQDIPLRSRSEAGRLDWAGRHTSGTTTTS